ncbi:hypothetical protein CAG99_13000 [Streptomyces marincola]|uniref:DUF3558 domain-containing protein n=1 Tax=Streptomyces marincola TaxID=2878388 RepID=A0A1W7CXY6_9ACTN|nr:hypothetical protein CAG99_13000 [Streptomyces marincola]
MLGAAVLVAGCGGSADREYSLPETLCGVELEEELYDSLFPGGTDVHVVRSFEGGALQAARYCEITVDDEVIVRADAEGRDTFEEFGLDSLGVEMADAEPVEGEHEALVWPGVAMAKAPCAVTGAEGHNTIDTLALVLEAEHPGGDDESREVLAGVIQPLFAGVLDMTPCEEHA